MSVPCACFTPSPQVMEHWIHSPMTHLLVLSKHSVSDTSHSNTLISILANEQGDPSACMWGELYILVVVHQNVK